MPTIKQGEPYREDDEEIWEKQFREM